VDVSDTITFGGVLCAGAEPAVDGRIVAGLSKETDSTSAAENDISRRRSPSPITTTNRPSVKVVMRPLMMLPSFNRIVSAKEETEKAAMMARVAIVLRVLREPTINPPFEKSE
jgi:hypothetical protein